MDLYQLIYTNKSPLSWWSRWRVRRIMRREVKKYLRYSGKIKVGLCENEDNTKGKHR